MAASILAGLTEAAILASVAQAASVIVDGHRQVSTSLGPIHVNESVSALLDTALLLCLLRLVLQAPLALVPARIVSAGAAALQRGTFAAFTRASWAEKSRDREGHLQEILSNQVWQASQASVSVANLVSSGLTLLMLVFTALLLNVAAAGAVLGLAIILFACLRPLNGIGARQAAGWSQASMNFGNGIGEAARLTEETQVFGVGAGQRERIDNLIDRQRVYYFRTQLVGRLVPSIYQSAVYFVVVAGLIAVHATNPGHIASLGAVVLLLVRGGSYGQQMQGAYLGVRQTWPYLDRVLAAQRRYRASEPSRGSREIGAVRMLRFSSVSYSYVPGKRALSEVTFEVEAKETVGIVGPSGAGKSTLVQLLLGLRVPDEGQYLVNGTPVEHFSTSAWCERFAYVPQEPRLLHASVAENISYFRKLEPAAIERAARLARIHDDIVTWPEGYDTVIGPRADAVSGGQQQRICIARALAAQPQVLVLDEPTSALDPQSEHLLQQSLLGLKHEMTLFIVAHRLSTIDICDRIMVISDGRLDAFDTASHLKQRNGYYRAASALSVGSSEATF